MDLAVATTFHPSDRKSFVLARPTPEFAPVINIVRVIMALIYQLLSRAKKAARSTTTRARMIRLLLMRIAEQAAMFKV